MVRKFWNCFREKKYGFFNLNSTNQWVIQSKTEETDYEYKKNNGNQLNKAKKIKKIKKIKKLKTYKNLINT